jgi:hypothetical protein
MDDTAKGLNHSDEAVLIAEVSDEALEAAARTEINAANTFATPTVNILVVCCGSD